LFALPHEHYRTVAQEESDRMDGVIDQLESLAALVECEA